MPNQGALNGAFLPTRPASLAAFTVPVPIVVGSADDQAAPGANGQAIAKTTPNAQRDILPKVTHYSVLPSCNERGKQYVKAICTDPVGVDRDALHQQVAARALEVFTQPLLGSL